MSEQIPVTATRLNAKALIAISVAIIVLAVCYPAFRHSTLFVDATTHQPERYTELYFSNSSSIPVHVSRNTSLPVSFVIHNVEARSMTYTYTISLVTSSGKTLSQKRRSFSLPSTQSKTVGLSISVPKNYVGKAEVQIMLENLNNQSIHFWVNVS